MRQVFLVRHGQTDWNLAGRRQGAEDIPLNTTGIAQAEELAKAISVLGIEQVVCSYLGRARKTAEILSSAIGLGAPLVVEGLHERDYGQASGLFPEEFAARFPGGNGDVPGLESNEALLERAKSAFFNVVDLIEKDRILVVSHGSFLNTLVRHFSSEPLEQFFLGNCTVSQLVLRDTRWETGFLNLPAQDLDSALGRLVPV